MSRTATDKPVSRVNISFVLNGKTVKIEVDAWETALNVIRNQLGLKGTKEGCGIGECGACTILLDGKPVDSCLIAAPQLDGREIQTVEGFSKSEPLGPLQQEFLSCGSVQCGYCMPGMLMSSKALLETNPRPTREDIVEALSGNLCRCTGYMQILEAVEAAANKNSGNRSEK
jgi:aerobic-type carbon monoxide dehydrogenase small subunit (CoxS/CutS family)